MLMNLQVSRPLEYCMCVIEVNYTDDVRYFPALLKRLAMTCMYSNYKTKSVINIRTPFSKSQGHRGTQIKVHDCLNRRCVCEFIYRLDQILFSISPPPQKKSLFEAIIKEISKASTGNAYPKLQPFWSSDKPRK